MQELPLILLSFGTSALLAMMILPGVLRIARERKLYDVPDERSSHSEHTPSLGGIAIFMGLLFSAIVFLPTEGLSHSRYMLAACLLVFLTGLVDDLSPVQPWQKLAGQLIAVSLLIWRTDIELTQFYGLFGLDAPWPVSLQILFTTITLLAVINAFNFIDGINGLAASLGLLMLGVLGWQLLLTGQIAYVVIAAATAGGLITFLQYNRSPARLFMGDTGSLLLGLVIGMLAIRFITHGSAHLPVRPVLAIGILFLPLFDTIRVFLTRLYRGIPPWRPDRRHIHHLLIDSGCSHMQATLRLLVFSIMATAWMIGVGPVMGPHWALLILLIVASLLTYRWHQRAIRHLRQTWFHQ